VSIDIVGLQMVPGISGFWVQDQLAIQTGAKKDGFFYEGSPVSPGFLRIKEPSFAYCLSLQLKNGATAMGDCVTVVDVGYADRPIPLRLENLSMVKEALTDQLVGKNFTSFKQAAATLESLPFPDYIAIPIAYGASQALLDAAARSAGTTMTEVLRKEFAIEAAYEIPGFAAVCEGDWYGNVDKAIARRFAMFPHCGIQRKEDVDRLPEYVAWMLERVKKYGSSDYKPDLHIDFHSMLGRILENDLDKVCKFLCEVSDCAKPYQVYFEDPLLARNVDEARENMRRLRIKLDASGASCRLIADEWANSPGSVAKFAGDHAAHAVQIKMPDNGNLLNSISAIRSCQENDVLAYLGGSVNETDTSARVSVHVGLAFKVWRMLAKPGKGLDEGLMIMTNELARTCGQLGITGPDFSTQAARIEG